MAVCFWGGTTPPARHHVAKIAARSLPNRNDRPSKKLYSTHRLASMVRGEPSISRSVMPPDNGYFIGVTTASKEYHGPRGNISQGGGAFLNHRESKEVNRHPRVPGYLGHKPFMDVVSKPVVHQQQVSGAIGASSHHFEREPVVRGSTYITPGYSGWIPGAQQLTAQTACRLPAPVKAWHDNRETAAQYDNLRSFRDEVGGVMVGYKGHVPGSQVKIGASNYGNIVARDAAGPSKAQSRWAQSRHTMGATVHNGLFDRAPAGLSDIEFAAAGVVQRSGGMVPPAAALAAARAAAQGAVMRAAHAQKLERNATLSGERLKTVMRDHNAYRTPGYKGHVPRYREEVGTSPYRARDAFRSSSSKSAAELPKRPMSAREPKRPLSARGPAKQQVRV